MSYEVLARRWRPQSFEEVSGQSHVTTALRNALKQDRLPHALLLAGPRGTGKTSIARILARSLNCDEGPTEKPCGKCSSCVEIAASTSLDVQEIDAASNTGVDNVREIRDNIRYAASPGKYRIYIIDEVHMLSQQAFNALLKTLEEPPPHSLFVFATTDPQKIPVTVLSRVQRFDLKKLGPREMLDRLRQIVSAEEISIPEGVLRDVVRESDGSLRDAQTMLDRLISAFGNVIEEEGAREILDLIEHRIVTDVLDPILGRDAKAALQAVRRAVDAGVDPVRLAAEILGELRNLLVTRLVGDPTELVNAAPAELAELQERARAHDPETLQRLFRVLLTRNEELARAPRPEHALEMAVVRLATLPEAEALSSLIERLDALEGGGPGGRGGPSGGGAFTSIAIAQDGTIWAGNGTSLYRNSNDASSASGWTAVKDFAANHAVIGIDIIENDSQLIRVVVQDGTGTDGDVWRSEDGGGFIREITDLGNSGYNGFYFSGDNANLMWIVGDADGGTGLIHKLSESPTC